MDITKLTDNSNVLALLSGEKYLSEFSKKDQKEAINILNDSPSLMMEYLSLDLDDEIDLDLYDSDDLEELLFPKLRANLMLLEHAISIRPTWLNAFDDSIISGKHILDSLAHEFIYYVSEQDWVLDAMRSSHISDQFIFESIKLDGLYSTDIKCAIISVLDLSKTEITDKAILALLIELRRIIEKETEQGENSIVYGDNGRFYHWTERIGGGHLGAGMSGVNTFEKFVKAITARNSKKITSELGLLKNCFEEYFKMLKKENIEDYVEEPIQAWIDAFGQ
jgi:hypothetical protein